MPLCSNCSHLGHCCFECVYVISEAETRDTRLVRIVRNTFFWLTLVNGLTPTGWRKFAFDLRCDLTRTVLDRNGEEVIIDLDALEPPDELTEEEAKGLSFVEYEQALEHKTTRFDEALRTYLDDMCCQPVPLNITPGIHKVNRAKFIALASVVAAAFPELAVRWPRHPIAANDNEADG